VAGAGLGGVVATGLVGIGLQATGTGGLAGFLVPVMVMLGCGSLVIPNSTALAMSRYGEAAGTAAAVVGAIQFGTGALVAPVVGLLGNDGVATTTTMTGSAVLAMVALTVATRRGSGDGSSSSRRPGHLGAAPSLKEAPRAGLVSRSGTRSGMPSYPRAS
jgi:DHA1 family bicyclomycin/chloramphenicol resistance-like MFS transporter